MDWFRGFNLVFNALDNLEARRHVNKMCLAANVPLIESGTTGFNGQVQVIIKVIRPTFVSKTLELTVYRVKLNATIATPKKSPKVSPSAPSAALPVSRSTVSSGQKATSSLRYLASAKMTPQHSITPKIQTTQTK